MLFVIIIFLVIFLFYYFRNYKFYWKTFFKKGLKKIDDRFGVFIVTGKMGSGKSYYSTFYLLNQSKAHCNYVKTNVKSLNVPGYKIEYFDKIDEIYYDTDERVIYIIDEVARKYDKNSRTDTQFYAWLNQSRKRQRIVILITQEWKELPMWLRRPARYSFTTKPFLFFKNIFVTSVGDAENMYLDKDTLEWECPIISHVVYKRNKYIADMYDTFEAINNL